MLKNIKQKWIDFKLKLFNKQADRMSRLMDIAYNNGYRERYIAKYGCIMYAKDGIFFNGSGIFSFFNGQFICLKQIKLWTKDKTILKFLRIKNDGNI